MTKEVFKVWLLNEMTEKRMFTKFVYTVNECNTGIVEKGIDFYVDSFDTSCDGIWDVKRCNSFETLWNKIINVSYPEVFFTASEANEYFENKKNIEVALNDKKEKLEQENSIYNFFNA